MSVCGGRLIVSNHEFRTPPCLKTKPGSDLCFKASFALIDRSGWFVLVLARLCPAGEKKPWKQQVGHCVASCHIRLLRLRNKHEEPLVFRMYLLRDQSRDLSGGRVIQPLIDWLTEKSLVFLCTLTERCRKCAFFQHLSNTVMQSLGRSVWHFLDHWFLGFC